MQSQQAQQSIEHFQTTWQCVIEANIVFILRNIAQH